jgi:glutathione S-transferase
MLVFLPLGTGEQQQHNKIISLHPRSCKASARQTSRHPLVPSGVTRLYLPEIWSILNQHSGAPFMKLLTSNTSPFVRKLRIAIREKGLTNKIEDVMVNVLELPPAVLASNPLGKIPVLIFDDGRSLLDSSVIFEFLDTLTPHPKLVPEGDGTAGKWAARRWEAIADGLLDSAIQVRLETVLRPADMQFAPEINRQMDKVERAVTVLESEAPAFADSWHIGSIAVACAFAWLTFRYPERDWRTRFPKLAAFEDASAQRESFAQTGYRA